MAHQENYGTLILTFAGKIWKKIIPDIKNFIVFGPGRFVDEGFDVWLTRLDYHGQQIDIGCENYKIFNKAENKWEEDETDFSRFEMQNVFGKKIPVIRPKDLISYKRKLLRKEDLTDIIAVKKYLNKK